MEKTRTRVQLEDVTIRFSGDSGDGMQLTGTQFSTTTANFGNDISTFPDFPAEIRAPAGTVPGVSGYQIHFSSHDIHTPGDRPQVLVAMNPAALKANIADLEEGGLLILNEDEFSKTNLKKADYAESPLDNGSLSRYRVVTLPLTEMTHRSVEASGLAKKDADRCKNFFALGMMYFLFDRDPELSLKWLAQKFAKKPDLLEANRLALLAGYAFAETTEMFGEVYQVAKAHLPRGRYRSLTGNEATALGFAAAAQLAKTPLFYGTYPITPASDVLHELARMRHLGVQTFQAEDEIAAICATIGAAYAGQLALTGTSGPGVCLKSEAINLAVMTELPIVILNVQRAGPSTGMPTKTEQSDLLQAVYGRNGCSPLVVLAPATPSECFDFAIEAFRIAIKYMVPVFLLTDGYIANGAEPWRIPEIAELPAIPVQHHTQVEGFKPFSRNQNLARPWAIPGTPGLEHRIGGIEKSDLTGNVCYDPANHQVMTHFRSAKVAGVAADIPPLEVYGDPNAQVILLGWGGTYGSLYSAVESLNRQGKKVAGAHFRYLNPFPANTEEILARYPIKVVAELNEGQLDVLLKARFSIQTRTLFKVQGKPFMVREVSEFLATL
jgi:2-oxoglutarate ferredoxin oxidoreductase subunit alpha